MTHDRYEALKIWQHWLAEHGLPSFPLFGITNGACRCKDGAACRQPGKHPKISGWRRVEANRFEPVGPLDNLGLSTDRLVVVDIDGATRPDDLPDTFTVQTGRGYHLWYLANPDKRIGNAVGWRHKVDIRSYGGLVAGPGSRHISGAEYQYVGGDLTPVPDVILDSFNERIERKRREQVVSVPESTSEMMQPLVDGMVNQILTAVQGTRNDTFFKIMCRYFEMANLGWLGADSLRELHQAALQAGLGHSETLAVIESASRSLTE